MRILLSNDDGVDAEGLLVLEGALAAFHDVWVCAPDGERSGTSHAIHLQGPVRIRQVGERRFSCSGTPADCVFLALRGSFIPAFDAVVSGINHGPNLGTDIVYSGTCAAARQAALAGVPALAVSLASFHLPLDFATGAQWLASRVADLLGACPAGHFVNVNFPGRPALPLKGYPAAPAIRRYFDKVVEFRDPRGDLQCFVEGLIRDDEIPADSDWGLVRAGHIAVSVIAAQPTGTPWQGEIA